MTAFPLVIKRIQIRWKPSNHIIFQTTFIVISLWIILIWPYPDCKADYSVTFIFCFRQIDFTPTYTHSDQFYIWAASRQNQQSGCAPSEYTDKPGRRLIGGFAGRTCYMLLSWGGSFRCIKYSIWLIKQKWKDAKRLRCHSKIVSYISILYSQTKSSKNLLTFVYFTSENDRNYLWRQ